MTWAEEVAVGPLASPLLLPVFCSPYCCLWFIPGSSPHPCLCLGHKGHAPDLLLSFSTDVPSWLKSLRLHKYAALFSQMSYEEMMTLTEQHLESQVKPRGPSGKVLGVAPF